MSSNQPGPVRVPPPLPQIVAPSAMPRTQWQGNITRAGALLTPTELAFWQALATVVDGKRCVVLAKCRLSDVCVPRKGMALREAMRLRGHMDRLHLDFVICDRVKVGPIAVVELDDASHASPKAQARDATKNAALAASGLGMVRVRVAASYSKDELAKALLYACGRGRDVSGPGWRGICAWRAPKK